MKKTILFCSALLFLLSLNSCGTSDEVTPKAQEDQMAAVVLMIPSWFERVSGDSALINETETFHCEEGTITETSTDDGTVRTGTGIFNNCLVVDEDICQTQDLELRMVVNGTYTIDERPDTAQYQYRSSISGTFSINLSEPKSYNFNCKVDIVARYDDHDWDIINEFDISGEVCGYDWKTEIEVLFDNDYDELCELIKDHV